MASNSVTTITSLSETLSNQRAIGSMWVCGSCVHVCVPVCWWYVFARRLWWMSCSVALHLIFEETFSPWSLELADWLDWMLGLACLFLPRTGLTSTTLCLAFSVGNEDPNLDPYVQLGIY